MNTFGSLGTTSRYGVGRYQLSTQLEGGGADRGAWRHFKRHGPVDPESHLEGCARTLAGLRNIPNTLSFIIFGPGRGAADGWPLFNSLDQASLGVDGDVKGGGGQLSTMQACLSESELSLYRPAIIIILPPFLPVNTATMVGREVACPYRKEGISRYGSVCVCRDNEWHLAELRAACLPPSHFHIHVSYPTTCTHTPIHSQMPFFLCPPRVCLPPPPLPPIYSVDVSLHR